MNNYFDDLKKLNNAQYEDKIVAFVDIMGMKQLIINSQQPSDLFMYTAITATWKNCPFAKEFKIISFYDCMYIIADKDKITELFWLLAHFSHCMLFDDSTKTMDETNNSCTAIQIKHCHKIRGGITFGKVFTFDTAVFGSAAIKAYALESKEAVYPRILIDSDAFDKSLFSHEYIVQDTDNKYYFDFMKFNLLNNNPQIHNNFPFVKTLIEFVNQEIQEAFSRSDAKLIGQLEWYVQFLEKYKQC